MQRMNKEPNINDWQGLGGASHVGETEETGKRSGRRGQSEPEGGCETMGERGKGKVSDKIHVFSTVAMPCQTDCSLTWHCNTALQHSPGG